MDEVFTYKAQNGNVYEIVNTFAEMFSVMETSPTKSPFLSSENCVTR